MNNTQTQTNAPAEAVNANRPTHVAKVRHGHGKNASYEQIGAAWKNDSGAVYVKLHGTQIVSAFTLYELPAPEAAEEPST